MAFGIVSLAIAIARVGAAQTIDTVAGGYLPNDVPASTADIDSPYAVALDPHGGLYIAASGAHVVYRVDSSGRLFTVAGNGAPDFLGDGGPANRASLNSPSGLAIDFDGHLYIADQNNFRIRRVDAITGVITTVAGNGRNGFSGDGGAATAASLSCPWSVAVDAAGHLYIADFLNQRIRRVDGTTGTITTVAGNGRAGFSGDGGPATRASLASPLGVAVDAAGNLYIADTDNALVRRVDGTTGLIRTIAGNGNGGSSGDGGPASRASVRPSGVAVDASGHLYIVDQSNQRVRRVDLASGTIKSVAGVGAYGFFGDGGPAIRARFRNPLGVAVSASGDVYIADQLNHRVRRVDAKTEVVTTVAGSGNASFSGDAGPAIGARLRGPLGVAVDAAANLFVADRDNHRIRRIDASTGIITTVAGSGTFGFAGDGGPATRASLYLPSGVAVDGGGDLFVADQTNQRIRRIDATTGVITTVAGSGAAGFSGDGGPAIRASLNNPFGVAVDGAGHLYIADQNNSRIRRVDAITGVITTVAGNGTYGFSGDVGPATGASITYPWGLAVDAGGHLFFADQNNFRIRRVDAITGVITTVAGNGTSGSSGDGGPATRARLAHPSGVAVDAAGHLYITDQSDRRIRRVDLATGMITTLAGDGTIGFAGDGGPVTRARVSGATGVAVDAAGHVYFADPRNQRVRRVSAPDPCLNVDCAAFDTACGVAACDPSGPVGNCDAMSPAPGGSVCREAVSACDVAETCDGIQTGACPADGFAPPGLACGSGATSSCDAPDTCDGGGKCLANLIPPNTTCRAATGPCDVAEVCDGAGRCPADGFAVAGTECRGSTDVCDVAEQCNGVDVACPADAFAVAGTECRGANGVCDLAERCSGTDGACPADAFVAAGTECRDSIGACDLTETCSGADGACPTDEFVAAGAVCGDPTTTACTASDHCDGTGVCLANHQACALVADESFCPFDAQPLKGLCVDDSSGMASGEVCDVEDPHCISPGTVCRSSSQFALAFAPDGVDPTAWKLAGTTPSGFSYNLFYSGPFPALLEVSIPYPFVTATENPVQVFDGARVATSEGCFQASSPVAQSNVQISMQDWLSGRAAHPSVVCDAICDPDGQEPGARTCRFQLHVADPGGGLAYVQVALAYGLVGYEPESNPCVDQLSHRYAPGALDARFGERNFDAWVHGTNDVAIRNGTDYVFAHDDGSGSLFDTVQNLIRLPEPGFVSLLLPGVGALAAFARLGMRRGFAKSVSRLEMVDEEK